MSEFVHLTGVEDITRAAQSMQDAASRIERAAWTIDQSLERFIERLEQAIMEGGSTQ